ncbi:MAG: protein rep [Chloroflexi bacterium]|nr:protein rep [Chloroflexota bacterium]
MSQKKETSCKLDREIESSQEAKTESQLARIERYSKAKRQAETHQRYIEESFDKYQGRQKQDLVSLYDKLTSCGHYLLFHHYYTIGEYRLAEAHFCKKHTVCPLCAIRRGAKMLRTYLERFEYLRSQNLMLRASLVTLTVKNGPDLKERFEHLTGGVKNANQRIRDYKRGRGKTSIFRHFLGYVGSYEVKRGKNSGLWHPHAHMIVLHQVDIDPKQLAKEWQAITGDSFIIDVTTIDNTDPVKAFCEVFKYALKFSSMGSADLLEAYFLLFGRQLVFSAGLFRGLKVPKDLTDTLLDDLPYIELLYRYTSAGYSLSEYNGQKITPRGL